MAMTRRLMRCPGALAAPVDDEIVLLPPSLRHYITLDPVGRRIWELLEMPFTPVALAESLSGEFAATVEEILPDLLPFLDELESEGLVCPAP